MQVNMHEAKTTLSKLCEYVLEGETVIICKNGRPMLKLVPFIDEAQVRQPGLLEGKIELKDGWDDPDPEIEDLFENSEL